MEDTNALIEQRRSKLASLQSKGLDPFKNKFKPDVRCGEAREKFEKGEFAEGQTVALAGRITAHRDMGKSQFLDLKDATGRIQLYAQKQTLDQSQPDGFEIFKHLDLADFIGVKGTLFKTRAGEISVKVTEFKILAKALRPPPGKWDGLADTEIRYRQRYLDLMANDDVKNVFLNRSRIVHEIRAFFHDRGYVEVETPAMQPIPGGAAAAPFVTKHNALGCEFYLRIALELYHKRLLVGGVDKLFEIGKNFRNEGLSRRHNPEFTMLEAYEAFGDYETMMETVETLITTVAQKVLGTLVIEHPLRKRFKEHVQNALDVLGNLHRKVRHDFEKSDSGSEPLSEAIRGFDETVKSEMPKLKSLMMIRTERPMIELFDDAIQSVAKCLTGGAFSQIALNAETNELSSADFVSEFEPALGSALNWSNGQFHALKTELLATSEQDLQRINKVIDLTPNWRRAKYKDLVRSVAGQDWFEVSSGERRRRAIEDLKLSGDIAAGYEDFEVTGAVFEKLVEPTLIQPTFVTHLPKELVPLAKLTPDDPTTVEVFECCINGQEIAPGYTEQNDPVAQRQALEHQAGGEQQKLDEDFLVALEHGMPPAGGIGIGIDRLCMMLLGQESIRDVILFPQMRPK
jgi:lysyl-tRNA synthetase